MVEGTMQLISHGQHEVDGGGMEGSQSAGLGAGDRSPTEIPLIRSSPGSASPLSPFEHLQLSGRHLNDRFANYCRSGL